MESVHFVSNDPTVLDILDLVSQVADTDATVLIIGGSGTGKELIAKALHEQSSRRDAPFLAVNCGAIADTLQESELFGHEAGSFTGATLRKTGKFAAADRGTIFLDEISGMSMSLQVKLLRTLQSGEYTPVGMTTNQYCNVRVVAATNEDLRPLIDAGKFRHDLYYRLNIIRVELPPLCQRAGDIPLLIDHFLRLFGAGYRKPNLRVDADAQELLLKYDYPGNVRELENIIRRAVILCRDHWIMPCHLAPEVSAGKSADCTDLPENFHKAKDRVVEEFERAFLTSILSVCGGIVSRAARRAGLSERNFHAKLRKHGIRGQGFRV
jgi:DNA-binding NtrC family response regulator